MVMKLTEKEKMMLKALYNMAQHYDKRVWGLYLFNAVQDEGWGYFPHMRELGGVLSSLVKKGIIKNVETDSTSATWADFTDEGYEIAKKIYEDEYMMKGSRTRVPPKKSCPVKVDFRKML